MVDPLELSSRATLCRKLAQREPENRVYWIAEAENWSRLSKESPAGEDNPDAGSGVLARLRMRSARLMLIVA
jgi:hypothetical protein